MTVHIPIPIPIGRRLALVSETDIEIYRFQPAGHVAATLGTTNGPVCAPLLVYSVLSADSIRLVHSDGAAITWTNIEIERDVLRAEREGRIKTFTIE
jgi:hypothetical protein